MSKNTPASDDQLQLENRWLDEFYLALEEPIKSCMLALRDIILASDSRLSNRKKYNGSFFCLGTHSICYVWIDKKKNWPYIGFVDGCALHHPKLVSENRTHIKILPINPLRDIPVRTIQLILKKAIHYKLKTK